MKDHTSASMDPDRNPEQLVAALDDLSSMLSPTSQSRRTLFAQMSAAALAMMFAGSIADRASAASRAARTAARELGAFAGVVNASIRITVNQVDLDPPILGIELTPVDNPDHIIHSATHTGVLTEEMIELMDLVIEVGNEVRPVRVVRRFNAMLRSFGLHELVIPKDPTERGGSAGYSGGFVLILVLFILLIIVGAGLGLGYGGNADG